VKNYLPAIACASVPILCYFLTGPYAEIGIRDDWSYIKTAQVLAQTGHIVYNGWGSPILGWHAYFGALIIKLFGFSFTAVRFSTVVEATATAFLLQRVCVQAGLNAWNATLATITFVLSPPYFPYVFTFMTDVAGVLCIVVCLYMCLRAAQAASERAAMLWISLAALVNAVGGTARQIVWLGVLVMVPSTLWLLRRSRRVLAAGCLSWIAGAGIIAVAMHWFARQPYSLPEPLIRGSIDLKSLKFPAKECLFGAAQLALLALPVLLMFAGSPRTWNRRKAAVFTTGLLFFALAIALSRASKQYFWLAPFVGSYMTDTTFGRLNALATHGTRLPRAIVDLHFLLTGAVGFGLLSLGVCLFGGALGRPASQQAAIRISWQRLGVIIGPFSLAYIVLLGSATLYYQLFFDRYLLPLLAVLLLVLARYYQEWVRANLPWACILLLAIFGSFSLAATHDVFAKYRGYVTAIDEIRSSGAPPAAILGPWEYEGWTEIEKAGYVDNSGIRVPAGAYVPQPERVFPPGCSEGSWFIPFVPAFKPAYAVTLERTACGGQVAFPPVTYRTWIAPHTNWIYDVRLPPSISH
jgi:hypothetical protein